MMRWLERLPSGAAATLIGVVVCAAVLGLRLGGLLEPLELGAYDTSLRLVRGPGAPDPRIVLVEFREEDIARHGHPLRDELLARALEALVLQGPRAIGVDLYRDRPIPPGDGELRRVVLSNPSIVMVEKIGGPEADRISPPPYVVGTSQIGFSDIKVDADGRVRRGLLAMSGRATGGLSLSARLGLRYLAMERIFPTWVSEPEGGPPILYVSGTPLSRFASNDGGYVGEDDRGYQILLDYRRGRTSYARYSIHEILLGALPAHAVSDRIVIVGSTAASVRDVHGTPFGSVNGIEHHADVVGELLDAGLEGSPFVRSLDDRLEELLVLAAGIVGALLAARIRSPAWLAVAAASGLLGIAAGALVGLHAGWWLPAAPAALAAAASGTVAAVYVGFVERRERGRMEDLFGRFLERDVAREIWRQRDAFMNEGRPKARNAVATILMADLQGYTSGAEKLEPQELMEWLNAYLDTMARVIGRHGGVVDDYAGDGVMANFGVPIPRTTGAEIARDARNAVDCALAMGAAMGELNRRWKESGFPRGRVRVGIYTGEVVVGMVGSSNRLKFTALGDSVNTASRLETHDKEGFAAEDEVTVFRVLVGDTTVRHLDGSYRAEPLGEVELRGRRARVPVYRIRGRDDMGGTS